MCYHKYMQERGLIKIIIILVLLILLVMGLGFGYSTFIYPRMQFEKAEKPDTDINTKTGGLLKKSEIKEKGFNAGLLISPSENDVISGTVTIKATDLPDGIKHVGFSINENFDELGNGGPSLGFDSDGTDGWEMVLDTTEYENGTYFVALFAFDNDASSNPLGVANVQVEVRN